MQDVCHTALPAMANLDIRSKAKGLEKEKSIYVLNLGTKLFYYRCTV